MNTKVQVAIGQHVGSSNSPLLNQLGAWFCGVAAGLGVVVSVPYVIRSLVCRTATNPSTVQRSLLRRSMAAVLHQPFVGHCLNIATCSISINFMMTKNPLLPPVMLGLMATMTTRDFIGRAISLSETNQVANWLKWWRSGRIYQPIYVHSMRKFAKCVKRKHGTLGQFCRPQMP